MKRVNKHGLWAVVLTVMLAVAMVLCLSACGDEDEGSKTPVSQYKSQGEYPTIKGDMLSWDLINSVPIKTANMDITEARKICVDFFRVSKSALWIPSEDFEARRPDGTLLRSMTGGQIYGGLPYITESHGNIYRLMDYMDPETGVVDIPTASRNWILFGNQCSFASYWGWARVINSATFGWSREMVQMNGYLRVGPYTYETYQTSFSEDAQTTKIVKDNGKKTMFESYAQLKAGDGIVYFTTGGHAVMIAQDAHVEYVAGTNTIDGNKSYVYIIDQAGTWTPATNAEGDNYTYAANTDAKWSFLYLYNHEYIPFTYAEWQGTDPIEETEISYSYTGDSISMEQIWNTKVKCNYGLSEIYAIVRDSNGNEVYKLAVHAGFIDKKEIVFSKTNNDNNTWGSLDNLKKNKEYTVEISAQIATGERPVLWTGKLDR